jgi:predicted dehydrogenase
MGGYGASYLKDLLSQQPTDTMRFIAAADPVPSHCEFLSEVQSRRIPVYPTLEALLAQVTPDLVVLSTPPQLHAEQVILSLGQGCHVLCEKPVACDAEDVKQMIAARDRTENLVAVGYQWSFSPAILRLKNDVINGRFGKPTRLRTMVLWPRDERYYTRNDWAGKQRDSQGRQVLDSPVNNACSHFLHNMFFVLGPQMDQSDVPTKVVAELYRANPIENYDTGIIRCETSTGAELLFIASHATQSQVNPRLKYEFERATIHFGGDFGSQLVAHLSDGTVVNYGQPAEASTRTKLNDICEAILNQRPVACGLEAAASQTLCMLAAQRSMPQITEFPAGMIVKSGEPGDRSFCVTDLESKLTECYERFLLPSDAGFEWARPGTPQLVESRAHVL